MGYLNNENNAVDIWIDFESLILFCERFTNIS